MSVIYTLGNLLLETCKVVVFKLGKSEFRYGWEIHSILPLLVLLLLDIF